SPWRSEHLHIQAHVGTTYKRALLDKNLRRDRAVPDRPGIITAFCASRNYPDRINHLRPGKDTTMRKPRDYDAELKALEDKAKELKTRKVQQLGELVIAT